MKASKIYVRFFRSFNYDYMRKTHPGAKPSPWDVRADGSFYPFVKVSLESSITTVVGGNEAGKSQLLSAVKAALTGDKILRKDFCRYSQFFSVDQSMAYPEFGIQFSDLSESERSAVADIATVDAADVRRFAIFRFSNAAPTLYLSTQDGGWTVADMSDTASLKKILPVWFEIDAETPLPDSVPIKYLAGQEIELSRSPRPQRIRLTEYYDRTTPDAWNTAEMIGAQAPDIYKALTADPEDGTDGPAVPVVKKYQKMMHLAYSLLIDVAGVDRSTFQELNKAVRAGNEGFANGIIERINKKLAITLNFRRHWSQDHHFALLVSLRDFDLVFTIQDRTGTEYSFSERSGGLKYFLSYFVQYLAHRTPEDGSQEILLMDEPDAYLSSSGQQDLLRIFEAFAYPAEDRQPCQVVYVTHSPFLIDKNHGERIRVLEKGEGDEGTRVVSNAARNHYEPLRSAFGSFVAETTFISNCNLMLEGPSDQVLLAGVAAHARRSGVVASTETLDLNALTLVPAGSASQVPYLVYLAKGRDVERPAVIVLLDSDKAGNDAKQVLISGRKKARLDAKFILQVGDLDSAAVASGNPKGVHCIEDLIPIDIALLAATRYVEEFLGVDEAQIVGKVKSPSVKPDEKGLQAAIESRFKQALSDDEFHLDKVGFARSVVAIVEDAPDSLTASLKRLSSNFRLLFRAIGLMQRAAMREVDEERTSTKINRIRDGFFRDHPEEATREQAQLLFEEIDSALGEGADAEQLAIEIRAIKREHELDEEVTRLLSDFTKFKQDVHALAYASARAVQTESME